MEKKTQVYTLIWDNGFVLKNDEKQSQNKIFLFMDEESKYMRLTYPSSIDLITRRTLERQLRQIQKRGFFLEKENLRIGQGYEYQMEEDRDVSPSSLKEHSLEKSPDSTEAEDFPKIVPLIREIKQIWIHKRTGEGSDMADSLENGQPSYFVSFLASNYQKLNILINSLPDNLS